MVEIVSNTHQPETYFMPEDLFVHSFLEASISGFCLGLNLLNPKVNYAPASELISLRSKCNMVLRWTIIITLFYSFPVYAAEIYKQRRSSIPFCNSLIIKYLGNPKPNY